MGLNNAQLTFQSISPSALSGHISVIWFYVNETLQVETNVPNVRIMKLFNHINFTEVTACLCCDDIHVTGIQGSGMNKSLKMWELSLLRPFICLSINGTQREAMPQLNISSLEQSRHYLKQCRCSYLFDG